jgi:NTP pyrophosphatase (non-canonical NTP hydrolase)
MTTPLDVNQTASQINEWAVRKGWRGPNANPRTPAEDFALQHSEVSEALEAIRINPDPTAHWFSYEPNIDKYHELDMGRKAAVVMMCWALNHEADRWEEVSPEMKPYIKRKPEGVPTEMADVVIRVMDFCAEHGIDLAGEILAKMEYNEGRPFQHGGKHL